MVNEVYGLRFDVRKQRLEFFPRFPVSVEGAKMMRRVNELLAGSVRVTMIIDRFIRALERGWSDDDLRELMTWLYAGTLPAFYATHAVQGGDRAFVPKWFEAVLRDALAWRRARFNGPRPYLETVPEMHLRNWARQLKPLLVPVGTDFGAPMPNTCVTRDHILPCIDQSLNPSTVPGTSWPAPAAFFEVGGIMQSVEQVLRIDPSAPSQENVRFADRAAWLIVYPSLVPGGRALPFIDWDTGLAMPRFEMLYRLGSAEGLTFAGYMRFRRGTEHIPAPPIVA